ncbi:hypothetical protein PSTT_14956 [Puccinia striiformis]|uniref:Uncharacterized protein n=1 Tax=Puccinia striiformis TaxID=27350 RepID=A0A2S4UJV0_9BASI|nr:hypothetical protein PSTT_14956 [Puccinia striiformis]
MSRVPVKTSEDTKNGKILVDPVALLHPRTSSAPAEKPEENSAVEVDEPSPGSSVATPILRYKSVTGVTGISPHFASSKVFTGTSDIVKPSTCSSSSLAAVRSRWIREESS